MRFSQYRLSEDLVRPRGPVTVQRKGETARRPGVTDRLAELGWNWEWLCAWRTPVHERPVPDRTALAVFLPRAATAGSLEIQRMIIGRAVTGLDVR